MARLAFIAWLGLRRRRERLLVSSPRAYPRDLWSAQPVDRARLTVLMASVADGRDEHLPQLTIPDGAVLGTAVVHDDLQRRLPGGTRIRKTSAMVRAVRVRLLASGPRRVRSDDRQRLRNRRVD